MLESSRRDDSIGGGFASLGVIDVDILDETCFGTVKVIKMTKFCIFNRIKDVKDFYGKVLMAKV